MLQPVRDRIFLKKLEESNKGFLIQVHHSKYAKCEVLAVGPGEHNGGAFIEITIKVGDIVLIDNEYISEPFTMDGYDFPIYHCSESRIIGIYPK